MLLRRVFVLSALGSLGSLGLAPASVSDAEQPVVTKLYDLSVASDSQLLVGVESTVVATVTASTDLDQRTAAVGVKVSAQLVELDDKGHAAGVIAHLATARTASDGRGTLRFLPPRIDAKHVGLRVALSESVGGRSMVRPISIEDSTVIHLRTDRGIYVPGTTLRWRATALRGIDSRPLANLSVSVQVSDSNRSPIWHGTLLTDDGGMVAGSIPLPDDARPGDYQISASTTMRGARALETVKVRTVKLPPFLVSIETSPRDPSPGEEVTATITSRFSHGEPVVGNASVSIDVDGIDVHRGTETLDRFGRYQATFTPPIGRKGEINVRVTDGAGRSRRAEHEFELPGAMLKIAVIPESPTFAPGPRKAHIITTDGRGNLVPTTLRLAWTGATKRLMVKSKGVETVELDVRDGLSYVTINASATASDDRVAVTQRSVSVRGEDATRLEVKQSVVPAGDAVKIKASWPERRGPVVATLIRHGTPLAQTVLEPDAGDELKGSLEPPTGTFGLATVRLTELRFNHKNGRLEPRSNQRLVFLARKRLNVSILGKVRHGPGDVAEARVLVTHLTGIPAVGVHLAASVVDERILALSQERPDLATVLDHLATGTPTRRYASAQTAGLAFVDLLGRGRSELNTKAMTALLAALPADTLTPHVMISEALRVESEVAALRSLETRIVEHMFTTAESLGAQREDTYAGWRFSPPMHEVLVSMDAEPAARVDPWGRPRAWSYAQKLVPTLTFDRHAPRVCQRRLDALREHLVKRRTYKRWVRAKRAPSTLEGQRSIPDHLRVDPWGQPFRVELLGKAVLIASAGPDELFDTTDDRSTWWGPSTHGFGSTGSGYGGGGGSLGGRIARVPSVRMGSARVSGAMEADIRKRFEQTVVWSTGTTTDRNGIATIKVPLADSITGWQVDIEAVGTRGGVGVARGRLETHRAQYVTASMPTGLSVGDRFELPLVVANHTEKSAAVGLTVKATGAISIETKAHSDSVDPGATRAFALGLSAEEPGVGTLTVSMSIAGKQVDAFERKIKVTHPGMLIESVNGHVIENGKGEVRVELSTNAADKTVTSMVRVFRGTLDRAIEGIDRLVREPHGCFEQTSSATYPNLLVLRLLKNGTEAPSGTEARARRFVAEGYQRLVGYEVTEGGFSWFGHAPSNQVLTAYGLIEFSDMSAVYPVDTAMIGRTRKWLLSKQRRDGSWSETEGALGGHSVLDTTAYIAWALAESGHRGVALTRALTFLSKRSAKVRKRPYALALWAAAEASVRGKGGPALRALTKQLAIEGQTAHLDTTGVGGLFYGSDALDVQASALAAMALHSAGRKGEARKIIRWLSGKGAPAWQRSTQGTVLALRAMALTSGDSAAPKGTVSISVNGADAGTVDLSAVALTKLDVGRLLSPGKNLIAFRNVGPVSGDLSVTTDTRWRRATPIKTAVASAEVKGKGRLTITRHVSKKQLRRGQRTSVTAIIKNTGDRTVEMPMMIAPMPPGFELAREIDVRRRSGLNRFENAGDELRFYMTPLAPGERRQIHYQISATDVVNVLHRPAVTYAYYDPSLRAHTAQARLIVTR